MTQLVLIAAGASFLMVMSLNSSLALTLDNYFGRLHYDSRIYFEQMEREDQIKLIAASVPGVERVELSYGQQADLLLKGQQVKDAGLTTNVGGIRAGNDIYEPLIVAGRWLNAQDAGRVLVIPRQTAEDYKINVGDIVTLNLGVYGKDAWQVIGLYEPVFVGGFSSPNLYAPMETLFKISKKYNQASAILVSMNVHDAEPVAALTKHLKDVFEQHSVKVAASTTQPEARATNEWQFSLVTNMLLALSIIIALVGAIALMGAISIGVIERTKEIGVLRAIGARSHTILGIFVMEGVLQGMASWLIAVPLSLLVSPPLATAMGKVMFGATLDYQYNWTAVIIWLGIVIAISVLASILPARGATRISVRDSLAYA
jgi:putative ABC transport system permease protein